TPPIIDMHMHGGYRAGAIRLMPDGSPRRRPCAPAPCEGAPARISSSAEIIPSSLAEMRKHNVVLGIVTDSPPVPKDERWIFDEWRAADPDRFLFGYFMSHPSEITLKDLRSLLERDEIQVIGELGFQYRDIAIDDPTLEPIFALAEEFDAPVLVHLGANGRGATFPIHLGDPILLSKVMRKHPNLRVWVENAGWPFLEEIVAVMEKYPNVYVDLSTVTWSRSRRAVHTHLQGLVDLGMSKRIMFGSDQMMWPETIGVAIETIESADFLTDEEKRDIFYNNAARFLRLSEEEIARHHGR
ncbi:MAG: amidohydrolase family protein, partial [Thermoanaerobaculia bacterium]|nr:amidohydrolase family protein [Thermoanaerobaculia bacterium]